MRFITKKHLPRRTFLRGMGVTVALPLLDSMLPAQTPLGKTAAAPKSRFCGIYVPHGATMDKWTPAQEGAGFRIHGIPEAARKTARSRLHHEQPGPSIGQRRGIGCRRGSRPFGRRLPQRRASGERFGARRHDVGPGAGPAHRSGHAAAIARIGHRRSRIELRLRLRLRLFQHHLLAHAHASAAHGEQSAGGVRASLRRWNQFGAAPVAQEAGPQHPRFGYRQSRPAAGHARPERPRPPHASTSTTFAKSSAAFRKPKSNPPAK